MRILFVSQHYSPEPINSFHTAEGLARRGHEVTALVGEPNYPVGSSYPGYDPHKRMEEDLNGVHVVRCPLHPRKKGIIHRVWNYYSFRRSGIRVQQTLSDDFDVVMSYQTSPVMMAEPAIAYAERTGTPLLLFCLDIWPACLSMGGIREGSPIHRYYRGVSRRIYQAADRLAVSSPLFVDYLRDKVGVHVEDPLILPQFAPSDFQADAAAAASCGYDPGKVNLTFAGNVGKAQSVDTIVKAAALLDGDSRFAFHILGSGTELERCRELAGKLGCTNIQFHGRLPESAMPAYHAASDGMLLTFIGDGLLGCTLPLKTFTYLASGKPVLCSAVGETCRVVEEAGCGFCAPAGDEEALADACLRFADTDIQERDAMGARARAYYEEHFTQDSFFRKLEGALEELKGVRHGSRL